MSKKLIWSNHEDLAIRKFKKIDREEYIDHMTFQDNKSPLFCEFLGPIIGLKEEWLAQGATPEELDFSAFRFRHEMRCDIPASTGWIGGHKEGIVEETVDHRITRDRMGRRMKMIKGFATIPLPMDYPVENMDDWRRIKKHYEFGEERFDPDWEETVREYRRKGYVVCARIPGGFDEARQLMGEEGICLALYDQPDLVHEIIGTIRETAVRVLDGVSRKVQIDLLNVHEDMAGKSGPLIGPKQIKEFILPYYRSVWDLLKDRGTRLFDQDSDGNMNSVIPIFMKAGVNVMHPMESAAGMDIVNVRNTYGTGLAFYGGIDKHVIRRSRDEIVKELEYKIPPAIRTGGCVLSLDHRIPNGTSLENYRFYVNKVWEIYQREMPEGDVK